MVKDMKLVVAGVVLALLAGCSFAAERYAAKQVEDSQELVLVEYVAYVENDPNLDADAKARRKRNVDAMREAMKQLRESLE
jgi:hypothetical protein